MSNRFGRVPRPKEKVGSRYKVVVSDSYSVGTIVELIHNDNTACPYFRDITKDEGGLYTWWDSLVRMPTNTIGGELLTSKEVV